jgi:predicted ester cyclase
MSVRDIHERLSKAFLDKDEAGIRAAAAPGIVFTMPGMATTGVDAYIEMARVWWNAFPDFSIEEIGVYADGNVVVEEGVFHGTHTGPMPAPTGELIPPTGRRIEVPYVDVFVIEGDRVTEDRLVLDRLTMLEQLGLVPEPGAAATAG